MPLQNGERTRDIAKPQEFLGPRDHRKTTETTMGEVGGPSPFGAKGDASKRSELAGVCGGGRGACHATD